MIINREEESLLLAAMRRASILSPFWRNRFSELGITQSDFVPGFDLGKLPFLSKADLLQDQRNAPPFGNLLAIEPKDIRRIHKTSGTSATPFFIALTESDIADTYVASIRAFTAAGMKSGDRVVHCLNFNMWSGGVTDYLPIEQMGVTAVPFGVGNTTLLLQTIQALQINAISSTPSYMFALRDRCVSELGINPTELGLRRGYFGGEGMLQVPGVREEIEQAFGMTAVDANYGMSEVTSIIAGEDSQRDGLVYHAHGILHAELIDGQGRSIGIESGKKGELVFSTLRRQGQPLFRYRTNDLAEILSAREGEDGLVRFRFRIVGRSDEMLVIKGVNFFPQSLLSILNKFEPEIGREFRVVRPAGGKVEVLTIVLETQFPEGIRRDELGASITARISALLQIRVQILWQPSGSLGQTGNKTRFLVDDVSKFAR